MSFREAEKQRLAQFKAESPYFSDAARANGPYNRRQYAHCLPLACADENLFSEIRQASLDYYSQHTIQWHRSKSGQTTNNLLSSQVACVNFLFPFADKPAALVELLRPVFPTIAGVVPLTDDEPLVAFEWIGQQNYLNEPGWGTRGSNCTSADAAVMIEHADQTRQIVLIEWKYAERYGTHFKGSRRVAIYRPLFERDDFPLREDILPCFEALFYEPFYQLFRQQALAHEMERCHELGADVVSVLNIAPALNTEFFRMTSPDLEPLGETVIDVWKTLVRDQSRFASVSVEALFGRASLVSAFPKLADWWQYITARYPWIEERE